MTEGYKQKEYGQAVKRYCQTLDLNTQRNRPLCVMSSAEGYLMRRKTTY